MKQIITIIISSFFIFSINIAEAQDEVLIITVDENNESLPNVEINEDALNDVLAPLQNVKLPEPQLSTGKDGEKQIWLHRNQVAPWDGVLLNPPAAAFIITEYEAMYLRAMAALERQKNSDMSRLKLEVGRLQLQIHTERETARLRREGQKREMERILIMHQELLDEQKGKKWRKILYVGGGALVGVATGILVGIFAVQ